MNSKRLLLFDIDGTMLSCRGLGLRAMHRAIQYLFGLPPVEARVEPQGKTDPVLFEEVGAAYGLGPDRITARRPALQDAYVAAFRDAVGESGVCVAKPGVLPLLQALEGRPEVVLGIVSGNLEHTAWLKLEAAGLAEFFAAGAFGSDGRRRSDLVALALERFAVREGARFAPERTWVIGDTPDDVAGGRAHGARTLAVATGSFSRVDLLRSAPDSLVDDFTDTAHVVDILCPAH